MTTYNFGEAPWLGPNWDGLPLPLNPGDIADGQGQTFTAPLDGMGSGASGNPITFRNFTVTNAAGRGVYIDGESFLDFDDVHPNNNQTVGLAIASLTSASNLSFRRCSFDDNGLWGVSWQADLTDPGGLTDIAFLDCTASRNVRDGIYLFVEATATVSPGITGVTVQRTECMDNGWRGVRIRTDQETGPKGTGLLFTDNTITGNGASITVGANGGGVTLGGFGLGETGFGNVIIARNVSSLNIGDSGGFNIFYNNYADVFDNLIEGNDSIAGGVDAAGILVDHQNQNIRVYRNTINDHTYDGNGSQVNVGIAIIVGDTDNVEVFNNRGSGNRGAFSFGGTPASNCRVYNNAFTGTLEAGVTLNADRTDNGSVDFRNNVITGTGASPEAVRKITGSGTWIEDYNEFFGFGAFEPNEGSLPGPNSTDDVDPDLHPITGYSQTTSPGYRSGEFIVGFHDQPWALDQNGFTFKNPPDIGLQSNIIAPETAPIIAEVELTALEIAQAQTLETPTAGQVANLLPVDFFQGQTLETPTVSEVGSLAVLALLQGQTLDNAIVAQVHELAAASLTQAQTLGTMLVFEDTDLGVLDSLTQAQSLLKPIVSEVADLVTEDLSQAQALGLASLSQAQNLALEGIIQAQTLGRPTISDSTLPRLTPPTRRIKVAGGLRVISWGA